MTNKINVLIIVLMFMLGADAMTTRQQKENIMPFNAGVIDATPTRRIVHFSYIDVNGQERTDSYDILSTITDAQLNLLATALGEASNASLWAVSYTNQFIVAPPSKANAVNAVDDSVRDNIVILEKNTNNDAFDVFIPAPLESLLVTGTLNPDPAQMVDLIAAIDGVWAAYFQVSYRYSERAKKNKAVKA